MLHSKIERIAAFGRNTPPSHRKDPGCGSRILGIYLKWRLMSRRRYLRSPTNGNGRNIPSIRAILQRRLRYSAPCRRVRPIWCKCSRLFGLQNASRPKDSQSLHATKSKCSAGAQVPSIHSSICLNPKVSQSGAGRHRPRNGACDERRH